MSEYKSHYVLLSALAIPHFALPCSPPCLIRRSAVPGAKAQPPRRRKCGVCAARNLLCTIITLDLTMPAASHLSPSLPFVSNTRIVCARFITLWLHGSRLRVRRCRPRLAISSRIQASILDCFVYCHIPLRIGLLKYDPFYRL